MRMLESNLYPRGFGASMSDEEARQAAEDYYYAALDLVAEGHHEQAVEQYQKSLASDPTFTEAMHGLSRALQDLNRLDEAIAVARRISEFDPDDLLAHPGLAVLDQKKGLTPEVVEEVNKARILECLHQLKKA